MDKQQNIGALFAKAQLTPTAIPFTESKSLFIKSVEAGAPAPKGKLDFINLKNILIMIGIIGILGLLVNISISGNETSEIAHQKPEVQQQIPANAEKVKKEEALFVEAFQKSENDEYELWVDLIQPLPIREILQKRELAGYSGEYKYLPLQQVFRNPDQVQFPKLTEKEIAANHKQKKRMIKALSKFDRKKYAYLPSGSYSHEEAKISVQSFYMQRNEVSNLEYRTFLFDLLIQGRKNDFLLAAPDQTLWTKALGDSLINYQNLYFSDYKFDEFPVVNVSEEGAKMYCKWITTETNKTKKSDFINDVRIPQLAEWTYAASCLGKQSTYSWEGDELTADDAFNANFKLDEYDGNLDLIKQFTKTSLKSRTSFEHTVGLLIAWNNCYEPNELGLYNMSGNVAEMVSMDFAIESMQVQQPTENQLVTCGGSWMSPIEDLKIFNENMTDNVNGHPSIGFRVVITNFQPQN